MEEKIESSSDMMEQLAEQYSQYFQIDSSHETKKLDNELETILVKLEEYKQLLIEMKSRNTDLLDEEMPQIFTHYQALLRSFEYIERVSNMVSVAKSDVQTLDDAVTKAEKEIGPKLSIPTILKPLLPKKDQASSMNCETSNYVPPNLKFDPSEFFPPKLEDS